MSQLVGGSVIIILIIPFLSTFAKPAIENVFVSLSLSEDLKGSQSRKYDWATAGEGH